MSDASLGRIVRLLADRGFTAEKAAARRIQGTGDPSGTVSTVVERLPPETVIVTEDHVRTALTGTDDGAPRGPTGVDVRADMTGASTGTGSFDDFVALFRDRYERLRELLGDRVRVRSVAALERSTQRHTVGVVGLLDGVRSSANGHWILEIEDHTGVGRALVNADSPLYDRVDRLLLDQALAVEGTLADDGGIIFVDDLYEPDVPRSNTPSTADRHVEAALISDLHVGSDAFAAEAWERFVEWLSEPAADAVEYLLVAGDLVEGVGVYPGQDEDLAIVDVREQYRVAVERLRTVPEGIELVLIPGNHDAVRLAEPQPAFEGELGAVLEDLDATVVSNPGWVDLEGVTVLLYHGTSLDDAIAEIPGSAVSYEHPEGALTELLRKRHLAPRFGGRTRIAPEEQDHLVIDPVPDVLHAGHTHTVGVDVYRGVRVIDSGCWQYQTPFQRRMNLDPDVARAAIVDLETLDVTVRRFE